MLERRFPVGPVAVGAGVGLLGAGAGAGAAADAAGVVLMAAGAGAGAGAGGSTAAGPAAARCAVSRRMRPTRSARASRSSAMRVESAASSAVAGWVRSRPHVPHVVLRSTAKHAGHVLVDRRSAGVRGNRIVPAQNLSGRAPPPPESLIRTPYWHHVPHQQTPPQRAARAEAGCVPHPGEPQTIDTRKTLGRARRCGVVRMAA